MPYASTREAGGLQLKDAYDAVNAYLDAHPAAREQYREAKGKLGGWPRRLMILALLLVVAAIVAKVLGY